MLHKTPGTVSSKVAMSARSKYRGDPHSTLITISSWSAVGGGGEGGRRGREGGGRGREGGREEGGGGREGGGREGRGEAEERKGEVERAKYYTSRIDREY